ncbi:MAG: phosphoribosylamine--glycine ligase [Opitutales bacterium]|nr:phosphoribosylamine--glycine ligase [Opitutales bacterium]
MAPEKSLRVLVVGGGGREHTLADLCSRSPLCREVHIAPGNGGTGEPFHRHAVAADDIDGLVHLADTQKIDFVVIGPEVPLSLGLVDRLAEKGIPAYGPTAKGARLEASKIFTKEILEKHRIPTAASATFTEAEAALHYVREGSFPVVIKADGLAAGKGVTVATSLEEAEKAIKESLVDGVFGPSGEELLIEECLIGEEASIHLIVSGEDYVILPTSQDHKRIGEGDTGPNTGGMGAYSPAELVSPEILQEVDELICRPSVQALAAEGLEFKGTLYIGIMLTAQGPKVLEFNVRFGDPETQIILPRLETDLLTLLVACQQGRLAEVPLRVKDNTSLCVVLAAEGYPGSYRKGDPIDLSQVPTGVTVYHAGTKENDEGQIVTAGGRVLGVCAEAETLEEASRKAYAACDQIHFSGKTLRRDIGAKQLRRQGSPIG